MLEIVKLYRPLHRNNIPIIIILIRILNIFSFKLQGITSLQLVSHLTDAEIKEKLSQNQEDITCSRWQIIYLIQVSKVNLAEVLAGIVNLSVNSIYKIVEKYNLEDPSSISYKQKAGRRKAYLSLDEEKELFISIEDKASKGQIKTAGNIPHIVRKR